uniref:Protein kinase domain-containing protein n=1 Tax=Leersia perrieri TaxID=77586 RepID=A0A0D9XV31_9ORYZ
MMASFIKTSMQLIGIIKERVDMFEETKADYRNALEYLNSITGNVEELKKNPMMMQDDGLVNTINNLEKIIREVYKLINSWEGYSNIFCFLYCHDLAKKLHRARNELQECLIAAEFGAKVALFSHITQDREHGLLPPQRRNRSQCAHPQDAGMVGSSSNTRSNHDYDGSDEAEQIGTVPAASNRPDWLNWLRRSTVAAATQILLLITVVAVALQPRLALPCWANVFDPQCSCLDTQNHATKRSKNDNNQMTNKQNPEVKGKTETRQQQEEHHHKNQNEHKPVMSCQEKNVVYKLVMAGRQADKFRDVQSKIDSYIIVFPFISHVDVTRRLDRIYKILLPNDNTTVPSSSEGSSHSHHLEYAEDVAQEMLPHGKEDEEFSFAELEMLPHGKEDGEFSFAELEAATNNFAPDRIIGKGGSSRVYLGRLADGREVAIKRFFAEVNNVTEFQEEYAIVSRIRHKHIIPLLGCCLEHYEKKITRSRWFWKRKVVDEPSNPLLVFDYMKNGSLDKHLHGSLSSSSPVTTSWSMRIGILLGVSQAIGYLHSHAERAPIIHRDIKPSNILLDSAWVPYLSDFGFSVTCGNGDIVDTLCTSIVIGTIGYIDPEYLITGRTNQAIDVYSFGIVMLELLTGLRARFTPEKKEGEEDAFNESLASFALPIIEAGELRKVLDRRPASEPTLRQLEALELVAQTAVCCLRLNQKDRPAILDVAAKLQVALDVIRGGE